MKYLITFILTYFLLYLIMNDEAKEEPKEIKIEFKNPLPDTTRVVFRFDWNTMEYVYADQLKPEQGRYHDYEAMPDFYVQTIDGQTQKLKFPRQVLKDGKRYRINQLPNGTLKLIPIR